MAPAQTHAGGSLKLTTNDAMTYLKDVKTMFEHNRGKYDEFLEVMRDFKSQRIDTDGVIMRVKHLFKGHNELILGFNAFLPRGYTIKLSEEIIKPPEEKKLLDFVKAVQFISKIKEQFQNEDHVYKSFLDILNMYSQESKSGRDVYQEVAALFHNHSDLMEEFNHFLPETAPIGLQHLSSIRSFARQDERFSMVPPVKNEHDEKIWTSSMAPAQTHADGSLKPTTKDAMTYLTNMKTMFEDNKGKYDKFLEVIRNFKNQRIDTDGVIMRVKQLFKGHNELILGFNAFLPTGYKIKLSEENINPLEEKKPLDFGKAVQFTNKIKERFQNEDHVYKSFLDILIMYRQESKSSRDVYQEIAALFHNHNDLMEEFRQNVPIGLQHL